VTPDVVTVAKALGNGFPIAAYITTEAIAANYTRPGAATFGGNLVACRAALAVLEFHEAHRLGQRSEQLGSWLMSQLGRLKERHAVIGEVRGLGLMIGVELQDVDGMPSSQRTDVILERMKDLGFLLGKTGPGRNVLTLLPPLVIEQAHLETMLDALDRVLCEKI
jgi:4-aminobutyrate aminotransferase-like enzyme